MICITTSDPRETIQSTKNGIRNSVIMSSPTVTTPGGQSKGGSLPPPNTNTDAGASPVSYGCNTRNKPTPYTVAGMQIQPEILNEYAAILPARSEPPLQVQPKEFMPLNV